jgi:hypothetical protein
VNPLALISTRISPSLRRSEGTDLLSISEQNELNEQVTHPQQGPLYPFMYALKSREARRQYPKRLKMLFDFLQLKGSLEWQALEFPNRTAAQTRDSMGSAEYHDISRFP